MSNIQENFQAKINAQEESWTAKNEVTTLKFANFNGLQTIGVIMYYLENTEQAKNLYTGTDNKSSIAIIEYSNAVIRDVNIICVKNAEECSRLFDLIKKCDSLIGKKIIVVAPYGTDIFKKNIEDCLKTITNDSDKSHMRNRMRIIFPQLAF